MEPMQYTVRGISPSVDKRLREAARTSHKSLNAVVIDILERATRLRAAPHEDLDWFIGGQGTTATADAEEREAQDWLDDLPNDLPNDLP